MNTRPGFITAQIGRRAADDVELALRDWADHVEKVIRVVLDNLGTSLIRWKKGCGVIPSSCSTSPQDKNHPISRRELSCKYLDFRTYGLWPVLIG